MSHRPIIKRFWFRFWHLVVRLTSVLFFGLRVWGERNVPVRGGGLICSNHQSHLDPILIGLTMNRPINYLARKTLFDVPGLGWLIRTFDSIPIDREGMGLGDVKFMGLVGAFLGWKAVLFTIFAASVIGTVVALPARLSGRQEWASKIPFGPYLVAGATIWMFFGDAILFWYTSFGKR